MDALSQDDIRNPTESITVNDRVIFIEILGERDSPQPNRRVIIGGKDYLLLSTKWDWGYRVGNKIDGTPIPTCDSFLTAAEKRKAHHCPQCKHAIVLGCYAKNHVGFCMAPVKIDGVWLPCMQRALGRTNICTKCDKKYDLIDRVKRLKAKGPVSLPFKHEDLFPEDQLAIKQQEDQENDQIAAAEKARELPIGFTADMIMEVEAEQGVTEELDAEQAAIEAIRGTGDGVDGGGKTRRRIAFVEPEGKENQDPEQKEEGKEVEKYDPKPWERYTGRRPTYTEKRPPNEEKNKSRKVRAAERKTTGQGLREAASGRWKKLKNRIKN